MKKSINSVVVGALVRQARMAAGLSQTELGQRIGASRFWVAQFEKGKPSAALGLVLRAMDALGLMVQIEPTKASRHATGSKRQPRVQPTNLNRVIADATLMKTARSSVVGWPTVSAPSGRSRKP